MSTKVSSKISKKNQWWISENRHMELRYFCLQYREWRNLYYSVNVNSGSIIEYKPKTNDISSIVENETIRRAKCLAKMRSVEQASKLCDDALGCYVFKAVTEGRTYEYLRTMLDIPCGRRQFYERVRKFFWILDKIVI